MFTISMLPKRLIIAAAAVVVLLLAFVLFSGTRVEIKFPRPVAAVGTATPVSIETDSADGVKAFTAILEQNGQQQAVYEDRTKSPQKNRIYTFTAGKKQASFLKEGPARLVLKAKANDLRARTTTVSQDIQVVLRPATIVADGRQHYVNQGGGELVVLELGGPWTEAGVRAGNYSAGSFPMPGQPDASNHRFSLFPYPWDLSPDATLLAFARNGAGTETTAAFWAKVFPKKFRESAIQLNDRNMQKVVGELDPEGSGPLVDRFVRLNREMRRANAQTLYNLRNNTEKRILWSGPFIPVKGARESYFADKRSYFYSGRKVDEQVHLGYDLAQTTNMPVKAANSGKVIYADRLGLYGNCIVIDHGYSLQSLYGHLSKIGVKVGDSVSKEQTIGISGSTGMAFGDHVHFSMMIAGVQVDPKEWWDEHWIHDRILSKIGAQDSAGRPDTETAAAPPPPKKAKRHGSKRG